MNSEEAFVLLDLKYVNCLIFPGFIRSSSEIPENWKRMKKTIRSRKKMVNTPLQLVNSTDVFSQIYSK